MSVASYAVPRSRSRTPRVKELRAYVATYADGVIELGRGAWVRGVESNDPTRFDPTLRLWRNVGDVLIVSWGKCWHDVAAVTIEKIVAVTAWREAWHVRTIEGDAPANGNCTVQAARRTA